MSAADAAAAALAADPKAAKAAAKLDAALAANDFYGALQVYRTIIKRKIDAGAGDEARGLLLSGATALLRHGKALEALDLGDMMLKDALPGTRLAPGPVEAVLALAGGVPPGVAVPQTVAFLRGALRWARACVEEGRVDMEEPAADAAVARLHACAARACAGGGPEFFPDAQRHFLEAGAPGEFAAFLARWASAGGYPGEADLFLARAVLQLLCLGNLRDANAVRDGFVAAAGAGAVDTPLGHFLRFLLLTLERDARPLFSVLCEKYAKAVGRDPALGGYLATIGARFYGIQPPPSGAEAMMQSLMGMFGGPGGAGVGGGNPLAGLLGGLGGGPGGPGGGMPDMGALMQMMGGMGGPPRR